MMVGDFSLLASILRKLKILMLAPLAILAHLHNIRLYQLSDVSLFQGAAYAFLMADIREILQIVHEAPFMVIY